MSITDKSSLYNKKNGRYVLGGTSEVSSFGLEWWEKAPMRRDSSDLIYFMEKKYEGPKAPRDLAYLFYADQGWWWVICMYNTIIDPLEELIEGKILRIPLKERVEGELFNSSQILGGFASMRTSSV